MKVENILDAIGTINDEAVQDARAYRQTRYGKSVKWRVLAACFCLILTVTPVALSGILKEPAVNEGDDRPGTVQVEDTRADAWFTAEELGIAEPQGTAVGGLSVPIFLSYRGGFYGLVETDQRDNPRFALSESEDLLFNSHNTRTVYLVENHPDRIAIHINGMEVYEKIFDVTFSVDGTTYAITYSPVMNADYRAGNMVLKTEDYTVYEAIKLQGEPAQRKEYIVDILPLLRRERPNLFDGSGLEADGDYAEQWQLALPTIVTPINRPAPLLLPS